MHLSNFTEMNSSSISNEIDFDGSKYSKWIQNLGIVLGIMYLDWHQGILPTEPKENSHIEEKPKHEKWMKANPIYFMIKRRFMFGAIRRNILEYGTAKRFLDVTGTKIYIYIYILLNVLIIAVSNMCYIIKVIAYFCQISTRNYFFF